MIPIGPLMREHRLIERMVVLMRDQRDQIESRGKADPVFIETAVDFFRTYADKCHHGKEEEILFRDLAARPLEPGHKKIMEGLIEDHKLGRKMTGRLLEANQRYLAGSGDALQEIGSILKKLSDFYPEHIRKEDKDFFRPCMQYFGARELERMLEEFYEFDRKLIHLKYQEITDRLGGTRQSGQLF